MFMLNILLYQVLIGKIFLNTTHKLIKDIDCDKYKYNNENIINNHDKHWNLRYIYGN